MNKSVCSYMVKHHRIEQISIKIKTQYSFISNLFIFRNLSPIVIVVPFCWLTFQEYIRRNQIKGNSLFDPFHAEEGKNHTKQDSRDSSPKPSSYLLDSICPNCSEYLQASQQSISAKDLSQASQLSISAMLKNTQQCSKMLNNAQKCSRILEFNIIAFLHYSMLAC